jgi:sugar lactone lactonase YvrE
MKTNLKAILSLLVGTACLLVGTSRNANAQSDLFVSVNAPGPGSTPGAVYRYTPTAVQSTFLPNVSKPRGLAFDSAGNMFLCSNAASGSPTTGTILRVTPDGSMTTFATGFTSDFFLEELAFDGAGNIFVNSSDLSPSAPTITGTVFKVLPDGTVTTFGTVPGQGFGVAVDSAGNVYAASAGTDQKIYRFTAVGAVRTVFADTPNFSGAQGPIGLMFDSSGNLFASTADSTGAGEILEFAPGGRRLFSPLA